MNTKKYLTQSIFALVLAIVGFSFSAMSVSAADWGSTIGSNGSFNIGVGSSPEAICAVSGNCGVSGGFAISNQFGLPSGSILGIASNILFWLLAIFAILGVVGFVISGIFYLVAAGDEGTMEKGKDGMKWSIMGIIIGLSGFIILQAVNMMLSGASTTF